MLNNSWPHYQLWSLKNNPQLLSAENYSTMSSAFEVVGRLRGRPGKIVVKSELWEKRKGWDEWLRKRLICDCDTGHKREVDGEGLIFKWIWHCRRLMTLAWRAGKVVWTRMPRGQTYGPSYWHCGHSKQEIHHAPKTLRCDPEWICFEHGTKKSSHMFKRWCLDFRPMELSFTVCSKTIWNASV